MGEFSSRRSRIHNMQALLLASMVAAAIAAPSAEPKADPYGFYGHHVYHGPPCKHAFVEETKEICHLKPNRVCEKDADVQGGDRVRGRRVQGDRGVQVPRLPP